MRTRVKNQDRESFARGVCKIIFGGGGRFRNDGQGNYFWHVETKCGPLLFPTSPTQSAWHSCEDPTTSGRRTGDKGMALQMTSESPNGDQQ